MATEVSTELDEPLGTKFDADAHAEHAKEAKALKANNLKGVFGAGVGRLALIAVIVGFVTMLAFGVLRLFKSPAPQQSAGGGASGAVMDVPLIQSNSIVTSEQEAEMRRANVVKKAEDAAARGQSYIAPPVLRGIDEEEASAAPMVAIPTEAQRQAAAQVPEVDIALAAQRAQRVAALQPVRDKVVSEQALPQILVALGRDREGKQVLPFSTQYYALPDRVKIAAAATAATAANPAASLAANGALGAVIAQRGRQIISAGDGYFCQLDFGINTDGPRKDVFATCAQGILSGAKLIGKYEEPRDGAGESGVSAVFSLLSFPGKPSIAVQAVAIDDSNGESYLADSVNSHSVVKYGGLFAASLLRGIGKAASIITGSTQTISNGAQATTITATDPITPQRQLRIAAGEVGTTFSDVIQRNSDSLRTTIRVNEKKGVRVVFLADVFEEKK